VQTLFIADHAGRLRAFKTRSQAPRISPARTSVGGAAGGRVGTAPWRHSLTMGPATGFWRASNTVAMHLRCRHAGRCVSTGAVEQSGARSIAHSNPKVHTRVSVTVLEAENGSLHPRSRSRRALSPALATNPFASAAAPRWLGRSWKRRVGKLNLQAGDRFAVLGSFRPNPPRNCLCGMNLPASQPVQFPALPPTQELAANGTWSSLEAGHLAPLLPHFEQRVGATRDTHIRARLAGPNWVLQTRSPW